MVVGFNTNGWAYHYESGVLLDMGLDSEETAKKPVDDNNDCNNSDLM